MNKIKKIGLTSVLVLGVGLVITYLVLYFSQETIELNDETRKAVSGNFIRLSKGFVHYKLEGPPDGDLVVLIGGAGLGYQVWDRNMNTLMENGYRVLRYDHYGRGYSDRVEENYSLNLFYNQFKELLDSLQINTPIHLAGLSMGAMVAIKFTEEKPDLVKNLILIDPAGVNPFRAPWYLKTPLLSEFLLTTYWRPQAVKKQIQEFYSPAPFIEYKQELETQIKIKGYKSAQHSIWLHTLSVDLGNEIKKIGQQKKEVLLLWGRQDPRTLIETSKFYLEAIPELKFIAVDKAGHLSNYERPDVVNSEIINFLKGTSILMSGERRDFTSNVLMY